MVDIHATALNWMGTILWLMKTLEVETSHDHLSFATWMLNNIRTHSVIYIISLQYTYAMLYYVCMKHMTPEHAQAQIQSLNHNINAGSSDCADQSTSSAFSVEYTMLPILQAIIQCIEKWHDTLWVSVRQHHDCTSVWIPACTNWLVLHIRTELMNHGYTTVTI